MLQMTDRHQPENNRVSIQAIRVWLHDPLVPAIDKLADVALRISLETLPSRTSGPLDVKVREHSRDKCQSPRLTFTSPPLPPTILPKQRGQEDRNATVLRQQDSTTQWRP